MSERLDQFDSLAPTLAPSKATTPEMSGATAIPTSATIEAAVPSLPPASRDADTTPPLARRVTADGLVLAPKARGNKPDWKLPKNSLIKRKALAIVAMRANGYNDDEIAKELHIGRNTLKAYIYRATKSGFLVGKNGSLLSDPHDRLQYDLAHKAVRNLDAMLDSDEKLQRGEKSVRMEATLALANGVLFKRFDTPKESLMPANVLQINIQGQQPESVDITAGGTPLYADGEIVGGGDGTE